jgi:hypothetical protein
MLRHLTPGRVSGNTRIRAATALGLAHTHVIGDAEGIADHITSIAL